jgi:hypothetical protein
MARYGVVIINFNGEKFLKKQIKSIRKYLVFEGSIDIIVVDNSRESKTEIADICDKEGVIYKKYFFSEGDNSSHHALALNAIFKEYRDNFNGMLFLDHDVFLFDKSDLLIRGLKYDFLGVGQEKKGRKYLHPGVLYVNLDEIKDDLDFLPCAGMDTGGRLADIVEKSIVEYLGMSYTNFGEDFYEVIDKTFMHFVKGSNWNKSKGHGKRLKYLFKELKNISK